MQLIYTKKNLNNYHTIIPQISNSRFLQDKSPNKINALIFFLGPIPKPELKIFGFSRMFM